MKKTVEELSVTKNVKLNHDTYLVYLQAESTLDNIKPGQFLNIQVKDSQTTYLRRPFSFHDVYYENNTYSVLIKQVGDGTKKLVEVKVGDKLDIVYPLGNGFSDAKANEKVLLIGGGVGIAPMMQLARESTENGAEVHILLGARSERDHVLLDEFKQYGQLHLTTDDGSLGTKGFVVDHDVLNTDKNFDRIYCCGPDPMMHAVARKAKQLNIECEVSLENMMACGFGVCLCCVTKTHEGNQCVCTDGPVFNINDLEWQI